MEGTSYFSFQRAMGVVLLALLVAPSGSASTAGSPTSCDRVTFPWCEYLFDQILSPCVAFSVSTPAKSVDHDVGDDCGQRAQMRVSVDAERALGYIRVPDVDPRDSRSGGPHPVAIYPSFDPVPVAGDFQLVLARAGSTIEFEVRFAPCADPLFRVNGEAHATTWFTVTGVLGNQF